jgi:hypothetical protein
MPGVIVPNTFCAYRKGGELLLLSGAAPVTPAVVLNGDVPGVPVVRAAVNLDDVPVPPTVVAQLDSKIPRKNQLLLIIR